MFEILAICLDKNTNKVYNKEVYYFKGDISERLFIFTDIEKTLGRVLYENETTTLKDIEIKLTIKVKIDRKG